MSGPAVPCRSLWHCEGKTRLVWDHVGKRLGPWLAWGTDRKEVVGRPERRRWEVVAADRNAEGSW